MIHSKFHEIEPTEYCRILVLPAPGYAKIVALGLVGYFRELVHGDAVVGCFKILGHDAEHWALYDMDRDEFIE